MSAMSNFKNRSVYFKAGDDIYQVTYVYATENARQASSVFKQIVNTFKATPPATARTQIL